MNLPKIKLGIATPKRSAIDLTHDVTTTSDFGFVQPIMCRELVPNSTAKVSVDSFVRLAPMPTPTFGRVDYKIYHQFVPTANIWEPFESFLSKKTYSTAIAGNYVPTEVPNLTVDTLTKYLVFGWCDISNSASTKPGPKVTIYDNTNVIYGSDSATIDYSEQSTLTALNWATYASEVSAFTTSELSPMNVIRFNSSTNAPTGYIMHAAANMGTSWKFRVSGATDIVTPDSADFVVEFPASTTYTKGLTMCIKFDRRQRHLRKILLGLGYNLNLHDYSRVSLLPLIAYFKAYWDIFAPKLEQRWETTAAHRLMEHSYQRNLPKFDDQSWYPSGLYNNTVLPLLDEFFWHELADAYYGLESDYVAAHLRTQNVADTAPSETYMPYNATIASNQGHLTGGLQSLPVITQNTDVDDVRTRILRILTKYVNKDTVIGGRIQDWLKVHYGADFLQNVQSIGIGKDSVNCQISDVMSMAETSTENLGAYAGKGIGYGNGSNFSFTTNTFGYWITLVCIVPRANYYQGIDGNLFHTTTDTYFQPEFDAVGYQLTRKQEVLTNELGALPYSKTSNPNSEAFGFIPRYSEMKYAKNVLNGDISLPSRRDSYCPYTLDKQLNYTNYQYETISSNNRRIYYENVQPSELRATPEWKYLGKYQVNGNFDRIFYNSGNIFINDDWEDIDDNFIIHNVINMSVVAPMKSLSESYDTDENANAVVEETKA